MLFLHVECNQSNLIHVILMRFYMNYAKAAAMPKNAHIAASHNPGHPTLHNIQKINKYNKLHK